MQEQNREIYFFIIIAIVLGLVLVGFIVTILFLYQRRQHQQEQELARLKDIYDREVLRSQLEIQESTLKTIAQELHDNIGQMLSVVKLSMSVLPLEKGHPAVELVKNSQQVLNKAILDLSDLTKSMHTDRIVEVGLADSIRFELASIKRTGILQVDFSVTGEEVSFDGQKSIFLFRMFQEMMNNILKHSKATGVIVSLIYSADDIFIMEIEDNGQGFDVEEKKQNASASGVGLKSIFSRAQLIGATIDVKSEPGKGTRITVELPYQGETNDPDK
ncbi:MAG: sensor histidine kinase [Bacteroidetes bacterium]|nr:sensor histidine kinase [Bacteroidota bacterium]